MDMDLIKRLFKRKMFLGGFGVIVGLFTASLLYFFWTGDRIPVTPLLFNESGKPLHAPYSGTLYPPLGTDEFGRDIAIVMLVGAKYTIGAAFLITVLRVAPALLIGVFLQFFAKRLKRPLKSIADSIHYFPVTLLAFLLLNWVSLEGVLMQQEVPSSGIQIFLYTLVLSVIFIPLNSVLIANEVELIYRKEFIECSKTLGAGKWRILTKHIRPFLVPRLFIIFIREFIQTLILMAHLGILRIFIGGTVFKTNLFDMSKAVSPTSEWAGTLGLWWDFLWTSYPWIAFIPILLLTGLVLAAKAMMDSLEDALASEERMVQPGVEDVRKEGAGEPLLPFQLLRAKRE